MFNSASLRYPWEADGLGKGGIFFFSRCKICVGKKALRRGPGHNILGLYMYLDEHLICCNLSYHRVGMYSCTSYTLHNTNCYVAQTWETYLAAHETVKSSDRMQELS